MWLIGPKLTLLQKRDSLHWKPVRRRRIYIVFQFRGLEEIHSSSVYMIGIAIVGDGVLGIMAVIQRGGLA